MSDATLKKLLQAVDSTGKFDALIAQDPLGGASSEIGSIDEAIRASQMARSAQVNQSAQSIAYRQASKQRTPVNTLQSFLEDLGGVRKQQITDTENRLKKEVLNTFAEQSDLVVTGRERQKNLYGAFADIQGASDEEFLAAKLYKENEIELKRLGVDPNSTLEEKLEALKPSPIESYYRSQSGIASGAASSFPEVYNKVKTSGVKFFFTGELGEQFPDGLSLQEAINGGYTYKNQSVAHLIRREIAAEHFLISGGAKLSPTAIRALYSTPVQEFLNRSTVEENGTKFKNQKKAQEVQRLSDLFQGLDSNPGATLSGETRDGEWIPGEIETGIAVHGSFESSIAATVVDLEDGIQSGYTTMRVLEKMEDAQYWSKSAGKYVSLEEFSPLLAQNIARLKPKVASRDKFAGDQNLVTLASEAKKIAEKLGPKDEFGFYTIKNEQELGVELRKYIRDNPDQFSEGFDPSQQDIQKILDDYITTVDEADDSDYVQIAIARYEDGDTKWVKAYRKIQSDKSKAEVNNWIKTERPQMIADMNESFQANGQIGKLLQEKEGLHSIRTGMGTFDFPYVNKAAKLHYKYTYEQALRNNNGDADLARSHAINATLDFIEDENNWNKGKATGVANNVAVNAGVTEALIQSSTKDSLPEAPVNGDEVKLLKASMSTGYMPKYITDFVHQTKYKFGGRKKVLEQRLAALEASGQLTKKEADILRNNLNTKTKTTTLSNSLFQSATQSASKAETTGLAVDETGEVYTEKDTTIRLKNITEAAQYTNKGVDAQENNIYIDGNFEDVNTVLGQEGPITFSNIQSMIITDNKRFRNARWGKYGFTSQQMLRLRELGYFDEADQEFTEENQSLALFELMKDVNVNSKEGVNGALLASNFSTITRAEGRLISQIIGSGDSFFNSTETLSPALFTAAALAQEEEGITEGVGGSPLSRHYVGPIDLRSGNQGRFEIAESIGETLAGVENKYGQIDETLTYENLWKRQRELKQVLGNARFEFLKGKATNKKTGVVNKQRFYELLLKEKEFANVDTTNFESRKTEIKRIQTIKKKYKSNKDYRYGNNKSIIDKIYSVPWDKDKYPVTFNNSFNNQIIKIIGGDRWEKIKNKAKRDAYSKFPPLNYHLLIQLQLREQEEFQ